MVSKWPKCQILAKFFANLPQIAEIYTKIIFRWSRSIETLFSKNESPPKKKKTLWFFGGGLFFFGIKVFNDRKYLKIFLAHISAICDRLAKFFVKIGHIGQISAILDFWIGNFRHFLPFWAHLKISRHHSTVRTGHDMTYKPSER